MSGLNIQKNRYGKISGLAEAGRESTGRDRLRAIVKVNVADYVPDNVEMRRRIDCEMFTAEFDASIIDQLEGDEHVLSVAISERLDVIE